jgi:hypothetical protein
MKGKILCFAQLLPKAFRAVREALLQNNVFPICRGTSQHFRRYPAFLEEPRRTREWLAGAGGIETSGWRNQNPLIIQRFQGASGRMAKNASLFQQLGSGFEIKKQPSREDQLRKI